MTPIEIIALILIIVSAIKIVVLLIKPQAWMNLTQALLKKSNWVVAVNFILAVIVLWFLLGAGITIVEILAVTAFVATLMAIGLFPNNSAAHVEVIHIVLVLPWDSLMFLLAPGPLVTFASDHAFASPKHSYNFYKVVVQCPRLLVSRPSPSVSLLMEQGLSISESPSGS